MRIPPSLSTPRPASPDHAPGSALPAAPRVRFVDWAPQRTDAGPQATERPAAVALPGMWPGRSQMQEVMPDVYVTNYFGARNLVQLKAQNITHIVVCAGELAQAFPGQFTYLQMHDFFDHPGVNLKTQLSEVIPWITQALGEGGRVLLHCAAGTSRSGAVAVALLMDQKKMRAAEALAKVQEARPIVLPNAGFLRQLEGWQRD